MSKELLGMTTEKRAYKSCGTHTVLHMFFFIRLHINISRWCSKRKCVVNLEFDLKCIVPGYDIWLVYSLLFLTKVQSSLLFVNVIASLFCFSPRKTKWLKHKCNRGSLLFHLGNSFPQPPRLFVPTLCSETHLPYILLCYAFVLSLLWVSPMPGHKSAVAVKGFIF